MPYTIQIKDARVIEVDTETMSLVFNDPLVGSIVQAATDLHVVSPLAFIRVTRDATDPNRYDYRFRTADGRLWVQDMHFDNSPSGPNIAFTLGGRWRLTELTAHRPLRDLIIRAVQTIGMTRLVIRWSAE